MRQAAERQARRERARAAGAPVPWQGPGGEVLGGAVVAGIVTVVLLLMWAPATTEQQAFEAGYTTASAVVEDRIPHRRGAGDYSVTFTVAGDQIHARLRESEAGPALQVGDTILIEYATSRPYVVRPQGHDSEGFAQVLAIATSAAAASCVVLVGWWFVVRRASRARRRP